MESRSNHSAPAPTNQQNVTMSQDALDKGLLSAPVDTSMSAGIFASAMTMPVQSIDILKETKEKADITKPSHDMMTNVPGLLPARDIPILNSIISQKQGPVASEEQIEIPAPNPTIVAQSIESGFLVSEMTEKMPSVQTVFPQQTMQSSAAQFKAEITVKDSPSRGVDNASSKIDEAPQELSFRRTVSSAPNNSCAANNAQSTGFDGFAGKMNKLRDQMSNIFPAGIMGCRDNTTVGTDHHDNNQENSGSNNRRFMDAKEASLDCIGHIDSTPRKRPSSCKPNTGRNPLTGFGLDDADDLRRGFGRRKDGNPVLGVGYATETKEDATKPTGRVPPGGHSTKLW